MQKAKIKRTATLAAVLFLLLLIILPVLPISAAATGMPKFDSSIGKAFVLYDKTHDKYVSEENGFALLPTSTSAKITMGLIACEMLADRLDEKVTVTAEMISGVSGYNMGLQAGEKIKIRDLLYGAICGSRNDAAYVLASVCSGNAQSFVEKMNTRILEIGAKNTKYVNPIGYPDNAAMLTTAYDVLKIARAASENELYMEICSAVMHKISATNMSSERTIYNRNALISSSGGLNYHNSSCLGMNAGQSGEMGGWSIVTLIRDKDKDGSFVDYICVLLGGKENEDGTQVYGYEYVDSVARYICKTFNNFKVFDKGHELGKTRIGLTMVGDAPYVTADVLNIYVADKNNTDSISYHVELNEDIHAPIKAGEIIGKVTVTSNGEKIGFCDVILSEDYEVNTVMKVIDVIGSYTKSRAFIITVVCFLLILGGYFGYKYFTRYSSKGRYTRRR